MPNVADILRTVEKRATGKVTSTYSQSGLDSSEKLQQMTDKIEEEEDIPKKKPTEVKPFNLTKPKPKVIPQPEPIKREVKSNPVPKNLFKKTMADIEKEKEERRKQKLESVRQQYEGNKQRFNLQVEERPKKFEEKKLQYIKAEEDKLQFGMKHARKVPDFDK